MTTLYFNGYNTYSVEQTTPKWMREERYGYCEQSTHHTSTVTSILKKLVSLFL